MTHAQWKVRLAICLVLLFSIFCIAPAAAAAPDVLFDGTVTLGAGNFTLSASGETYEVAHLTPFGAIDVAAEKGGFTYVASLNQGKLVLDNVSTYVYEKHVAGWECRVNGNLLDYWGSYDTEGYPNYPLMDGDEVVFLYGPDGTVENATAFVNITVSEDPYAGKDVLYDGAATLGAGNFTLKTSGESYEVANLTPFGALEAAANMAGFTYVANLNQGRIVLDNVSTYVYEKHVAGWECRVNGNLLDYWGNYDTEGYPNYPLKDGDEVVFLYGPDGTVENATAVIAIDVQTAAAPGDWTISLNGACSATVTKAEFEEALACNTNHAASWTDPETGETWSGMPLWMLVAMVDDEETGGHYTFNDALAAEGYSVKITSKDGYNVNIPSADMARDSGFIVANTLNGSALPETIGEKNKPCWPLQLKGSAADAGQLVGGIASIELVGLPEPGEGWTLKVCGVVNDTITEAEFEAGEACHGSVNYTDNQGVVWTGIPLWYLVGVSDSIETTDHWTFDDTLAATNYTVRVVASDNYNQTYGSAQVARSNGYILANLMDGQPIPETNKSYPLKLVGDNVPKNVKSVAEIDLVDLITGPAPEGSWNLDLKGKIDYTVTEDFFEEAVNCSHHTLTWTDPETGATWGGIALWQLCGFVDDRIPHGSNGFNDAEATAGYMVIVTAADGYSKEFSSKDIARNNNYIVANTCNGTSLSKEGDKAPWPLRLVGSDVAGSNSVGAIASIELTDFQNPTEIPSVHIIKYDADDTTVLAEKTVNYTWMEENLKVYGDGETVYRFQGPTFDPDDLWNPAEDINVDPGKVYGAVKGTAVKDLCDLVGGMDPGTEITLEASDRYQTKMNYTNIYNPLKRQGTAVLAWYKKDEGYVPDYSSGYRLYFITPDTIFGNDDMRASFAKEYWHYYSSGGIQYPSAGGLSARNIETIKIYQPEKDWTLTLEGTISADLSKAYFEEGLSCEASHRAEYTDNKGRVWEGMPLWRLIGWVDDNNEHTGAAFNDTMAAEGYTIHVIASDGYEQTFTSQEVARNSNYILANTVNGSHIDPEDSAWPLKLVGTNVSKSVRSVARIAFIPPGMGDVVQQIGNITAGSEKNFTIENCTFENLTLRASGDITGGEFAVSNVDSLPQGVPAPDSQVYQFVHVLYPQPQDTIGNATITFAVPLSWLSAQGIDVSDVVLLRYHDGAWQQLPTTYLESSGGLAYFTATTPGFSYFAVGGTVTPTPTPTLSPTYHRSSSGGGSSAISAISGSIPAGESKTFSVTETAFSTIEVRAYDQISDLLLTVQAATLPKNVTAPDGAVYELEKVTLYRTDPSAIDGVVITFAVDADWLKDHGVSTGDVSLLRYVNGQWTSLKTTFVEEKDGQAYYSAESPGFSIFAITAAEGTAVTPAETAAPVTGTPTEAQTGTMTEAPTATPSQQSPVFWALPLIAFGVLLFLRRR